LNPQHPVSETERVVLKVLWDVEKLTVREMHATLTAQGYTWAYTTVQTLMNRLFAKGYVSCDKSGTAHIYRATVSRGELLQLRLHDLADSFCEGTSSPLVLALVEGSKFTPEEIATFRGLLDKLESQSKPKHKGSP
jgi:BlaI family transcriptional regulator, penicillinase repressor